MKKKSILLSIGCAFALCIAVATPSSAADDRGFYIQYNAGTAYVPNQNLTSCCPTDVSLTTGQQFSGSTNQRMGFNVGGAVGMRFLEFFRAELEYMYRQNEVTNFAIQTGPSNASGHVGMHTVMANVYVEYDLEIGIVPYAGIGIGWGGLHLKVKNREFPELSRIDSHDGVFAYALMAGGSIPVNEVIDVMLGYRYLRTTDSEVKTSLAVPSTTPTGRRNAHLDYEYDAHEALFGLRVNF